MEMSNYLYLLVNADKEAVITHVNVVTAAAKFTSQLANGYTRKKLIAYNNSDSASGELYYGYSSDVAPANKSRPIPKGAEMEISVQGSAIDVYFCSDSGEMGDLRVEEIS